ncbi:protein of unknown function [Vibrio tapetis subsp. tapetis]|uniref:Uncharacterized protein n=1 Tax=Vibrio tapetis subsp. tapetis TaxID=1671868 RepID=A0A2N8ZM30_9VIBR|nr:protein of unknown function [Vibrio tapetis subsp. tapetis]
MRSISIASSVPSKAIPIGYNGYNKPIQARPIIMAFSKRNRLITSCILLKVLNTMAKRPNAFT